MIKPSLKITVFLLTISSIWIGVMVTPGNAIQTTFAREELEQDQPEVIFPTHFDTSAPLGDLVKKE